MSPIIIPMIEALVLCAVLMLILWYIQVKTNNASWVDIGWTLSLGLCAVVYATQGEGYFYRKLMITVMALLWSARLGFYLLKRMGVEACEDKRYQLIRQEWKTHLNIRFFFFFQFQALVAVILSTVWLPGYLNQYPSLHFVEYAGLLLWLIGFWGESIADRQLARFKLNPANNGKVCDGGLWKYSRHPNYFFEWLMWVAYAVYASVSPYGWVGIAAPMIMYYFLMHLSGVPLAEAQSLKTKGEAYRRYQATTSMFFPWFKKG